MSREFDFNIRKLVACYKPLPNPKPTFIFFQLNDCSRKEEMNIFNTVLYKNLGLGIKPGQDPHFFLFWQQYTFLFLFFFFFFAVKNFQLINLVYLPPLSICFRHQCLVMSSTTELYPRWISKVHIHVAPVTTQQMTSISVQIKSWSILCLALS